MKFHSRRHPRRKSARHDIEFGKEKIGPSTIDLQIEILLIQTVESDYTAATPSSIINTISTTNDIPCRIQSDGEARSGVHDEASIGKLGTG
jgi:hypothetical protein